jgi:hypothetical protein
MSDNDAIERGRYSPAKPSKFTLADLQGFKELIEASPLKWWVIAAGIGGGLEGLHILWLAARFLYRALAL